MSDLVKNYGKNEQARKDRNECVSAALELVRAKAASGTANLSQMIPNIGVYADHIEAALERKHKGAAQSD